MARPSGPGGVGTKGMKEPMENPPRLRPNTSYVKGNKLGDLLDERWFEKVNPIANSFRKAITLNLYRLPQDLYVDEILVQFPGRLKYTI
jgi:hypothetical protein